MYSSTLIYLFLYIFFYVYPSFYNIIQTTKILVIFLQSRLIYHTCLIFQKLFSWKVILKVFTWIFHKRFIKNFFFFSFSQNRRYTYIYIFLKLVFLPFFLKIYNSPNSILVLNQRFKSLKEVIPRMMNQNSNPSS